MVALLLALDAVALAAYQYGVSIFSGEQLEAYFRAEESQLSSLLPRDLGAGLSLASVEHIGPREITEYKIDLNKVRASGFKVTTDQWPYMIKSYCSSEHGQYVSRLGGLETYEYVDNRGSLFAEMTATPEDCKRNVVDDRQTDMGLRPDAGTGLTASR